MAKKNVTQAQIDAILRNLKANPSAKQLRDLEVVQQKARERGDVRRKKTFAKIEADRALYPNIGGAKPAKDPQTNEYLAQMQGADRDSAALGKPREEKKSWFNKTIDFISRGNFAAAEAFQEAFDPKTEAFYEPWEALKGFGRGLAGKEKTTFKDVLNEQGYTGRGAGTLGLVLDIGLDPLTYTGVGVAAKAGVASKKAVNLLNEVGKLEADLVWKGANPQQVREVTNAAAIPVQNIKKKHLDKLTPEARQVYEYAVDARGANASSAVDKVVTQFKRKVARSPHIDLRAFSDDKLREIATETVRAEEKAYPGLTSILRRVRATKTTSKDPYGNSAPADAYAAYERMKAGHIEGNIRMHPDLVGNRDYMSNYGKNVNDVVSVKTYDAEEALRYVTTHEIGHQLAQAMSDDVKKSLWEKMTSKYAKETPTTRDDFVSYFRDLESRVLAAEKSEVLEPLTATQKAAQKHAEETGNWKFFSEKRGYTPEQIADHDEYVKILESVDNLDDLGFKQIPYPAGSANAGKLAQTIDDARKLYDKLAAANKVPSRKGTWAENLSEYSTKSYPDEVGRGTPGFEEMTAEAWAEFRIMGNKARPMAKEVAQEMIKRAPKVPSKAETSAILKQLADDAIDADVTNIDEWATRQIEKKYGEDWYMDSAVREEFEEMAKAKLAERGITDIKAAKKAIEEQLLSVTARNLNPGIKKQFQLKIGPTAVGIPKSYEAVTKAANAVASIPGIKQSIDKFNELFRANAHIPKALQGIRSQYQAGSMFLVTQHIRSLQSVFGPTNKVQRQAVLKAFRDGAFEGNAVRGGLDLDGQPVEDLVSYLRQEVDALDLTVGKNNLSLDEINSFLKGHFKVLPVAKTGTKKVKVTDPDTGRVYLKTVKTTTKEISNSPILDAILANTNIKDPAQALFLYTAAVNQAVAKRNMWTTIAQTHGVPKGDLGKELVTKYGWVESKVNKAAEGFYFPPEVAEGMAKIEEVFKNERSTGMFVDQYDRALQGFKSVVTRYNPSFHSRTFLGEMLLGYMGGMKNIPRSYSKAGMVIKGRNQQFLGTPDNAEAFGEGASKRLIQASNVIRGAVPGNADVVDGSKTVIQHARFGSLSADKIWHLFMENGLKSGFAATDLVRGVDPSKLTKPRDVMQSVTEGVEDYGRLAHFIDAIQYSKAKTLEEAVEQAAAVTRKYHLDYTNVTHFERNVMTRAIPFYKWMRLSTPVMAEILFTQPGKALALPKAMREISEMAGYDQDNFGPFPGGADAVIPDWLRDNGALPMFEFGGNTNYFDPTALFPLAGSLEAGEGGFVDMVSPFAKWGSDLYQGKDKFGNQLTGDNATGKERLNYLLAQTPQTNFANQMITKRDPGIPRQQTLLQFLANPGIQPNTEKRMRGEAFRQRQEAYSHRKKLRKEQGIIP